MAKKKDDEEYEVSTYRIPHNFNDSGRVLGGMLALRNLIEAIAFGFLIYLIEDTLFFESLGPKLTIIIMILSILPISLVSLIGINGDPLTKFVFSLFVFLKNKRKMRFRRIYNEKAKF